MLAAGKVIKAGFLSFGPHLKWGLSKRMEALSHGLGFANSPGSRWGLESAPLVPCPLVLETGALSRDGADNLHSWSQSPSPHPAALRGILGWQRGCWPGGGMPMRDSRGKV